MTSTITVKNGYRNAAGQVLSFVDQSAFELDATGGRSPSVVNEGSIEMSGGGTDYVFQSSAPGAAASVWNKAGGVVSAELTTNDSFIVGLYLDGDTTSFVNDGSVDLSGSRASGGTLNGTSTFTNTGHFGVDGGDVTGLFIRNGAFTNSGDFRLNARGWMFSGVVLESGSFHNSGAIVTAAASSYTAVYLEGAGAFYNSGHLTATATGANSVATGFELISNYNLINTGVIRAAVAIKGDQFNGQVHNNGGHIYGDVLLGLGNDEIVNSGMIKGYVHLAAGADHYSGAKGGWVDGVVYGDGGGDTLVGGAKGDLLYGDLNPFDPDVARDYGRDSLVGAGGADWLDGGREDDTLSGGAGYDSLIGGQGADRLTGGTGGDTFIFNTVEDSSATAPDRITDLHDIDVIDLYHVDADANLSGDQAFHLVAQFSGQAGGEARLVYDRASKTTELQLDVDGDKQADGVILISGDHRGFTHFVM